MAYWKITNSSVVETHSLDSLLAAWAFYGQDSGVGRFVITEPLTARQLRALPTMLRGKLDYTKTSAA